MEFIELHDVQKVYRLGEVEVPVLRGVSLLVKRGEMVALMGVSGSAKSTLMNILGCLDRLREAQWFDCLQVRGQQLRGPCPIHGTQQSRSRSFSVHLHKNVFHCFDASCGAHGNALDLWAQIRKLPLYEAARDLAERLGLQQRNREEEPVKEPVAIV